MNDGPVGIFDSGIGGLTVVNAIHSVLPSEPTLYLGDTARVPYGPKSPATVRRYSHEILDWMLGRGVKAIVVACNTATAHALESLRAVAPVPLVGVIDPGARAALAATRTGRVGVIGTNGTIGSGAYRRALLSLEESVLVTEQPCPLFVPLVEEGWLDHAATRQIAAEYLAPLLAARVDTLVLGCTHYPLLKPLLAELLGDSVTLIDSGEETARDIATTLEARDLLASRTDTPERRWAATDDVAHFLAAGSRFLDEGITTVELVELTGSAVGR